MCRRSHFGCTGAHNLSQSISFFVVRDGVRLQAVRLNVLSALLNFNSNIRNLTQVRYKNIMQNDSKL